GGVSMPRRLSPNHVRTVWLNLEIPARCGIRTSIPPKRAVPSILHENGDGLAPFFGRRSEEHTSELQSRVDLVCRLLLEKKNPISSSPLMLPRWKATNAIADCQAYATKFVRPTAN